MDGFGHCSEACDWRCSYDVYLHNVDVRNDTDMLVVQ